MRPHAWRYRDYVIRSLNQDKPYDRFLTEQLAGDELTGYQAEMSADQIELLAATGFLRLASDPTDSPSNDSLVERMDVVHDEIRVLSSSVLGMTMGCARCHDHKYDPISQLDYYRFSAILQTAYDPYDWLVASKRVLAIKLSGEEEEADRINAPIQAEIDRLEASLEAQAEPLRKRILERRLSGLPELIRLDLEAVLTTAEEERTPIQAYLARRFHDTLQISEQDLTAEDPDYGEKAEKTKESVLKLEQKLRTKPAVRALFDMGGEPYPTFILQRGEANSIGDRVQPGVPTVLATSLPAYQSIRPTANLDSSGNRLAPARWLSHPDHPLTARVVVNRIWMHHFGRGIVETPANFGRTGSPPTHPELLDWLASELVGSGWSWKSMHRLIVNSTTYRQSSRAGKSASRDPENRWWSRMPMRRMDAETLFDSLLRASGRLDRTLFGRPVAVEELPSGEILAKGEKGQWRRAIYFQKRRRKPITLLEVFDAPRWHPIVRKEGAQRWLLRPCK